MGHIVKSSKPILGLVVGIIALFGLSGESRAEVKELRIAKQYGFAYLPLMMMEHDKLVEQEAKASGLGDIRVSWLTLGGPAAANDALLAGSVDLTGNGPPAFLAMWDKTRGNYDVKGVAAVISQSMFLNTNNPNIKSLRDFSTKDKIALTAVKVSIPALILEMAAAREFGDAEYAKFDPLTVSLAHPDGMAALISGISEIDAHFTSPPYQYIELKRPNIHTVITSDEVLGGPGNFTMMYTTSKFRTENPKVYAAFLSALTKVIDQIKADKPRAAQVYLEMSHEKTTPEDILEMLNDPNIVYTTTPQAVMKYADFMHRTGRLKAKPESWKDFFFPEIHNLPGS